MIPPLHDQFITYLNVPTDSYSLPDQLVLLTDNNPHPLCLLAAEKLQLHLTNQQEWHHNFGLQPDQKGTITGKMFGVLVVRTQQNEIGYLSAFSGKLAGGNHHSKFVPPVFDGLTNNSFLNNGMEDLTRINREIKRLENEQSKESEEQILFLKNTRKSHSSSLQNKIFDHYTFLNKAGETKSLNVIFKNTPHKRPPSGAGECAAPKLLQYAFQHNMKPIAMAEFWWGRSPKSELRKHREFYPHCQEKCGPILAHMLSSE